MQREQSNSLIHTEVIDKIGTFHFYKNIMVSEINEGINISLDVVIKITHKYTKKFYPSDKPFVYISNRINSYSFEPTIHIETRKLLPNTIGFAVVTYTKMNNEIANLEQLFLNDISKNIFNNLEDAMIWAQNLLKDK